MNNEFSKKLGITFLCIGFGFSFSALWLLFSSPHYQAEARIDAPMTYSNLNRPYIYYSDGGYDPFYIVDAAKEIQMFALTNVIAELNLCDKWKGKYTGNEALTLSQAEAILEKHLNIRL